MKLNCYYRPIIPLLIAYIFGILGGSWFSGHMLWARGAMAISAGWMLYKIIRRSSAAISPLILFFSLGYLSLLPWVNPIHSSQHVIHFADASHPWEVTGTVVSMPVKSDNRFKMYLEAESLLHREAFFAVTGKIRVTVWGRDVSLQPGNKVAFVGRIKSIRNFKNPGGFDYRRHMAFEKVWVTSYVHKDRLKTLAGTPEGGFRRLIDASQRHISQLIDHVEGQDRRGVLKALIIGDKQGIPQMLRESFNRSGAGHVLAISGLHMGIVAAAAFFVFTWLSSWSQTILWAAWAKKSAALLSLFPVVVYGLLAGMSPSTQRAAIMVGMFLLSFIVEAEQDTMNTLAMAAMVILIVFPPSLFSISFQLSFAAVGSIIFGLKRTRFRRKETENQVRIKRQDRLWQKPCMFLLVSMFAYTGTLPLVMFYFNQISLVAPMVNLLVVPLIGFAAVPLGLTAAFLSVFSTDLSIWIFKLAAAVLTPGLNLVQFFSNWRFASIKTVTPSPLEIVCFYVLAWAILYGITSRAGSHDRSNNCPSRVLNADGDSGKYPSGITGIPAFFRFTRPERPAKAILTLVLLVLFVDVICWIQIRFRHHDLRVTVMDVGQGNAALLELPGGPCILVDGGGFPDNAFFDVGARIVAPLLWRKKIATIDVMVLSHPNSDHLNGLLYLARHFNVHTLWSNHEASDSRAYGELMEIISEKQIPMPKYPEIFRTHEIHGVRLDVFYPPVDFLEKRKSQTWRNDNNNSLVLKVSYGSVSFLFPGDIMRQGENELVQMTGNDLKSTVLMAPHHGSRTSSSSRFLDAAEPEIVIVSAGWKNHFGFPHDSVLNTYMEKGYRILRTDIHGAIMISTDGRSVRIDHDVDLSLN